MRLHDYLVFGGFGLVFLLGIVWFVLVRALFSRLEACHAEKYEEMGRPSLFLRNNLRNNYTTIKFLFAREHQDLDDPVLSRLSDAMLILTVVVLVVFLGMLIWSSLPPPRKRTPWDT